MPETPLAVRLDAMLRPDPSRTVLRPFDPGEAAGFIGTGGPRAHRITARVLAMSDEALARMRDEVVAGMEGRHRDVRDLLLRRFEEVKGSIGPVGELDEARRLVVAAYFIEEFSFESAALFNPSVVEHPDQSGLAPGDTRILLSLRGIGEGHISSLTFRTGVWRADGGLHIDDTPRHAVGPALDRQEQPDGQVIVHLDCAGARSIAETVIFPFTPSQGRGLEDVRLVRFTEDDGSTSYRGTFTAFNGTDVRQALLHTPDFRTFEIRGVQGAMYAGKGMALFPRRVGGRYMMLGRQDNENIWLLSSDEADRWEGGDRVVAPKHPWEFVQMGNCGSPIEIDEGWLVLTHGVGDVRTYSVGAVLLDKEDPSRLLARSVEPLLAPSETERDGYVPNVVYSCGALLRGRTLLLPYGVADDFTAFATVEVDALLASMA